MSQSADYGCCRCCCSFIVTAGFAALFMWLTLRPSKPTCSIEHFDVFALNKTATSARNNTIYFDLTLKNNNKDEGVYYDTLNLTFYYKPNLTFPLANYTFSGFRQGHQKHAQRVGTVEAGGSNWQGLASSAVKVNGTAVFKVDLKTAVRYKIIFWKTKRHKLALGADLQVNAEGSLVRSRKKGVKLTSGTAMQKCYCALVLVEKLESEVLSGEKEVLSDEHEMVTFNSTSKGNNDLDKRNSKRSGLVSKYGHRKKQCPLLKAVEHSVDNASVLFPIIKGAIVVDQLEVIKNFSSWMLLSRNNSKKGKSSSNASAKRSSTPSMETCQHNKEGDNKHGSQFYILDRDAVKDQCNDHVATLLTNGHSEKHRPNT
ncbi:hypothetical protein Ancab_025193 [Ancistrocladus abbreviatus]